jgi:murein tripeptide amidase MpaA
MRPNNKKRYEIPPEPFYIPTGPEDTTLVFESRFETGNLLASIKVTENEYDLFL